MNEEVVGSSVVRTIKYRADDSGLIQTITKVASYFISYPPHLYNTRIALSHFNAGVYEVKIMRNVLASDVHIDKGQDLDLSKYIGRVEYVELVDYIQTLKTKIITLKGWKGNDEISIEKVSAEKWVVKEHRKDKDSKEVGEVIHEVLHEDVQSLWDIIRYICDEGQKVSYRDIVKQILDKDQITDADEESFNGGKNRSKYYFPLYYYPLKILEYLQFVKYHGRGGVTKLKQTQSEVQ